ncbi:MAG: DNA-3-methyladenine glycosylase family protein [Candidatus Dojkabacteria bacterium]
MNSMDLQNYNLEQTLLGGQSFTWEKTDENYIGTYKNSQIVLNYKNNILKWQTFPKEDDLELITSYLNIDSVYESIIKEILKDEHIINAVKSNSGVRILNQDFETVLMNFILSSHKSVKGVRKLVKDISKEYGVQIKSVYGISYSFPTAKVISNLTEKDLRDIGAGFRAPYLKAASEKLVKDKLFIENLYNLTTEEVKEYLMSFKGIGEKIADCILVFGLKKTDITPLDIWGKRVLTDFYNIDQKTSYKAMSKWYSEYFGKNTAIAGQMLFEYIRKLPKQNSNSK